MMKKTILALTASLALAGFAQAQEFDVELDASVPAICTLDTHDTNVEADADSGLFTERAQNAFLMVNCNLDLPYNLYLANTDGIINLEGTSGSVLAIVTQGTYWDEGFIVGDSASASVSGVGTGAMEYVDDVHIVINPDIPENPIAGTTPEAGTYQGVAQWVLSF